MTTNRGIPGIPRGRGGFGRGGRGRGVSGAGQGAGGGYRGRGRGGPNPGGGYGQPNGLPLEGNGGGAEGPPTGTLEIPPQAPSDDQHQQKGSRGRRSERRKTKKLKGNEKDEVPVGLDGGGDDIIEIDFKDMEQVFGPAPGATSYDNAMPGTTSDDSAAMPGPPQAPPPLSPVQAQFTNQNRGSPARGRGRGRGGRGGFHPTPLPGQGGYLAPAVKQGGYNHTDFDLQQYAYPSQLQASGSKPPPRGNGANSQPQRGQHFQPKPQYPSHAGGRRNGANFRGFAYDYDADDPAGEALRKIARKGLGESSNIYLRPVKFVKSSAVLFQDQEQIFAAEVVDNDTANLSGAAATAGRVEQVFHSRVKPGSGLAERDQHSDSGSESGSRDENENESADEADKPVPTREEVKTPPPRLEVTTLLEATARIEVPLAPDDDGDDIVLITPIRRKASVTHDAIQPTALISVQEQVQEEQVQEAEIIAVANEPAQVEVSRTEVTAEVTTEVPMDAESTAGPSTASQPPQPDTTSDELIANLLQVQEDSKIPSTDTKESKMLHMLTGCKREPKQQRNGGGKRARQAETGKGKGKGKGKGREKINWNAKPLIRNEDINWSTPSSEAEGREEEEDDLGGMDVDPDLAGPSYDQQYAAFVDIILRAPQENQVSAADFEAEAEDSSDEEGKASTRNTDAAPSSSSKKRNATDQILAVIEGDDDGDDGWTDTSDSDEADDEMKPDKARKVVDEDSEDEEDEDEDDDELIQELGWNEEDGETDLTTAIQSFLDENSEILQGGRKMKKEKRKLYASLRDIVQDDDLIEATRQKKRKKKQKSDWITPDLADQWQQDRQKKAENKRKRAEALRAAMEAEVPGNKRSKKLKIRLETMEGDSDLDSDLEFELEDGQPKTKAKKGKGKDKKKVKEPPKPKFDVWKIGRQIQGFVGDRSRNSLQLPPMDKDSRRRVHEIAIIYNLTSQSSGKGANRATTLRRNARTTLNVNERKLDAKLKNWEDALLGGGKGRGNGGGEGGDVKGSGRHREGDIVGQHAAKIGSENAGYQLLQMMGWTEGARMGVTGGLEAPIHAVFKATKLGLGSI